MVLPFESLLINLEILLEQEFVYSAEYNLVKRQVDASLAKAVEATESILVNNYSQTIDYGYMWKFSVMYLRLIPGKLKLIASAKKKIELEQLNAQQKIETILLFTDVYEKYLPLLNKLQLIKKKVVKGRKPISTKGTKRTLKNTGTCAICNQNIKLSSQKKIANHGFIVQKQRVGSCFGVNYLPLELSTEALVAHKEFCLTLINNFKEKRQHTVDLKDHAKFDRQIKFNLMQVSLFEEKINSWKPKPLPV